jgi:pimeloyl-ACP methyl ester carboxylesterase
VPSESMILNAPDGTQLDATLVTPDGRLSGVVVLAHGITGDKDEHGKYERLANQLAEHGLSSLRFSYRGHGHSEGRQLGVSIGGEISDLYTALRFAESLQVPISIVAFSFGAVSTLAVSRSMSRLIRRIVLWSPVLDLHGTFFEPHAEWGRWNFGHQNIERAIASSRLTVDDRFDLSAALFIEMQNYDFKSYLGALTIPTFVAHGTNDECVSFEISRQSCRQNSNVTFLPLSGANHDFDDPDDEDLLRDSTVEFLRS